nr:MAG TPA: hypothetical protein [Caudoviricetes sp.]
MQKTREKPSKWLSKASKCVPAMLPFGFYSKLTNSIKLII